jgi:hypothetical protein
LERHIIGEIHHWRETSLERHRRREMRRRRGGILAPVRQRCMIYHESVHAHVTTMVTECRVRQHVPAGVRQ